MSHLQWVELMIAFYERQMDNNYKGISTGLCYASLVMTRYNLDFQKWYNDEFGLGNYWWSPQSPTYNAHIRYTFLLLERERLIYE